MDGHNDSSAKIAMDIADNKVIEEYSSRGYTIEDAGVSFIKALTIGVGISLVLVITIYVAFHRTFPQSEPEYSGIILLLCTIISMPIHELLHAIGFMISCHGRWKQDVRIGVQWKTLTPYCTCSKPMHVIGYAISGLLPFVLLGIGSTVAAFITGSQLLMWLGCVNVMFAGGDLLIAILLIIKHPGLVLDHPKACGFIVLREPSANGKQ